MGHPQALQGTVCYMSVLEPMKKKSNLPHAEYLLYYQSCNYVIFCLIDSTFVASIGSDWHPLDFHATIASDTSAFTIVAITTVIDAELS